MIRTGVENEKRERDSYENLILIYYIVKLAVLCLLCTYNAPTLKLLSFSFKVAKVLIVIPRVR